MITRYYTFLKEDYYAPYIERYMYPIPNNEVLETVNIFRKDVDSDFKLIRNTKVNKQLGNNNENSYFIYFTKFNSFYFFKNRSYQMSKHETIENYGVEVEDIDLELNAHKYNI